MISFGSVQKYNTAMRTILRVLGATCCVIAREKMLNNALRVHATVTIGTTRPFIAFFCGTLLSIHVDELRVALLPLMRRILHAVL